MVVEGKWRDVCVQLRCEMRIRENLKLDELSCEGGLISELLRGWLLIVLQRDWELIFWILAKLLYFLQNPKLVSWTNERSLAEDKYQLVKHVMAR